MKNYLFLFCAIVFTFSESLSNAQTNYKIVGKCHLEGDGGWDYLAVDEINGNLYVSHGSMVQVVDLKTFKIAATIPDTKGVHGIAIANDLNKGFTSNGRDSSVTVFDLKTFEIISKIKLPARNPDAILYDSFSKKVFTFNGGSKNTTVLDANNLKVLATIPLEGKPEFSVTNGKGKIFVNIEDKNSIAEINVTSLKVEQLWSIAPGDEPSGLAIDNQSHRLFTVCGNKKMVITNAETGKVITTVPIGDHCDGVAFDPEKKCAFSSNGEGSITVVKEVNSNEFKVTETVKTQPGARTIAVNKVSHHLYLSTAEFESVSGSERPKTKSNSFIVLDIAVAP